MPSGSASAPSHITRLRRAYQEVGHRTWLTPDFLGSNLEISRALYTPESLVARRPRPRELEVFALLSGLPFHGEFAAKLVEVQGQISAVLGERLHYWVEPANFGVEYCVFKWPADPWNQEWLGEIRDVLASTSRLAFRLDIGGVQINPDGCVVALGFDEESRLFGIRDHIRTKIQFLPKRQSAWAHVPLGRILEPVGPEIFAKLAELQNTLENQPIASTEVCSIKLVHETRWYMEERTILNEYPLSRAPRTPSAP